MSNNFLIISIFFGLLTPTVGGISIIKGIYKPHRITRIISLLVSTITFLSLVFSSSQTSVFLAAVQFISGLIIFVLSIKSGVGGKSKFDMIVFAGAVLTIIAWRLTSDPFLALNLSIFVNFIGQIPTIIKCYRKPKTEDPLFWMSDIISSTFSLLALVSFNLSEVLFPLYVFVLNVLCLSLIIIGKSFNN